MSSATTLSGQFVPASAGDGPPPLLTRPLAQRPLALLCAALAGAFACYMAIFLYLVFRLPIELPFGDFFALWSYARIAATHDPALLYDPVALHAAQVALGMPDSEQNPYPYPPTFRLLLVVLTPIGYWSGLVLWLGASFALYLAATLSGGIRGAVPALAAVLAPTTTITVIFGQSGFLVAALLVGGLRLAGTRPLLAGLLFGLLTYKPQFGVLVPVALIAAGQWRCIAASTIAALAFAGLATAVQGWAIWPAWLASIPGYQLWFDTLVIGFMPTLQANLQMLGAPIPLARALQGLAGIASAGAVWFAWRHARRELAIPVLLVATCVATPHAFVYDLPILTAACVLFIADRLRTGVGFTAPDVTALLAAFLFPALMLGSPIDLPIAGPALLLLLGVLLRDCIRQRSSVV